MIGNIVEWLPALSVNYSKGRVVDVIIVNNTTQYLVYILQADKEYLNSLGDGKVVIVSPGTIRNVQSDSLIGCAVNIQMSEWGYCTGIVKDKVKTDTGDKFIVHIDEDTIPLQYVSDWNCTTVHPHEIIKIL